MESADRTARLIAYQRIQDYMFLGDNLYLLRATTLASLVGLTLETVKNKYKVEVMARRPADQSSGFVRMDDAATIAADDDLLLIGSREYRARYFSVVDLVNQLEREKELGRSGNHPGCQLAHIPGNFFKKN